MCTRKCFCFLFSVELALEELEQVATTPLLVCMLNRNVSQLPFAISILSVNTGMALCVR